MMFHGNTRGVNTLHPKSTPSREFTGSGISLNGGYPDTPRKHKSRSQSIPHVVFSLMYNWKTPWNSTLHWGKGNPPLSPALPFLCHHPRLHSVVQGPSYTSEQYTPSGSPGLQVMKGDINRRGIEREMPCEAMDHIHDLSPQRKDP